MKARPLLMTTLHTACIMGGEVIVFRFSMFKLVMTCCGVAMRVAISVSVPTVPSTVSVGFPQPHLEGGSCCCFHRGYKFPCVTSLDANCDSRYLGSCLCFLGCTTSFEQLQLLQLIQLCACQLQHFGRVSPFCFRGILVVGDHMHTRGI